jgi:hypothetical protein
MGAFLNWLAGGVIGQFTGPLLDAYKAKLAADGDQQKLAAQRDIDAISTARDIAVADLQHRWSATAIGRWLIVVPWGLYWAAGCLIQLLNPWFGLHLVVVALPPGWDNTAMVLIPSIIVGDAGAFIARVVRSK